MDMLVEITQEIRNAAIQMIKTALTFGVNGSDFIFEIPIVADTDMMDYTAYEAVSIFPDLDENGNVVFRYADFDVIYDIAEIEIDTDTLAAIADKMYSELERRVKNERD